jgi:hypothetical protein
LRCRSGNFRTVSTARQPLPTRSFFQRKIKSGSGGALAAVASLAHRPPPHSPPALRRTCRRPAPRPGRCHTASPAQAPLVPRALRVPGLALVVAARRGGPVARRTKLWWSAGRPGRPPAAPSAARGTLLSSCPAESRAGGLSRKSRQRGSLRLPQATVPTLNCRGNLSRHSAKSLYPPSANLVPD